MSAVCHRSGAKCYPGGGDKTVAIGGMTFLLGHFTCKKTGTKLTLKTATIATDPVTGEKDVYLRGEGPGYGTSKEPWQHQHANQVADAIETRVKAVPDSNMRSNDRMFNTSGKQANRGAQGEDAGSNYGQGAVVVDTQVNAPKVPTSNDNINLQEVVHNGVETYTNATGEAPAE